MRKTLLLIAMAFAILLSGCKKDKGPGLDEILVGTWTLEEYQPATKSVTIGTEPVYVSVTFNSNHTFRLIQKVGPGYTENFEGTWSIDGSTLNGVYSDKKPWGEKYDISFRDNNNTLEMKTLTAREIYIYQRYIEKE